MNRNAATPTTQKMGREWVDNDHHKRTQKERKNYYIIRECVEYTPWSRKQKKIWNGLKPLVENIDTITLEKTQLFGTY